MYDVVIIGAGPAGMMASIAATKHNKKVLIIEKNDIVGKKLKITGGTRCNITNLKEIKDFIKEIPVNNKFLYSTLNQFGPTDIYEFFKKQKVYLKVEDNNRVFPVSNDSQTIIDALYSQMKKNKVEIKLNEKVISLESSNNYYTVKTDKQIYKATKVIITTGGKSYPHTGSTGDGYKLAENLNHFITKLYPAETFLISAYKLPLSGITVDEVDIKVNKHSSNGSLLFTHVGISGPAVFKISEYVYQELKTNSFVTTQIDFIPNITEKELIETLQKYNPKKELITFLKEYLPKRLAEYITEKNNLKLKIGELSKVQKLDILNNLKNFQIEIKKTGTIEQSFVTGGGIDIKYINPKTMESTISPNIYFAGEILDVHGHTGGYNITIALSTGYTSGNN